MKKVKRKHFTKRIILSIIAVVILVLSLIPYTSVVCPAWEIQVIDEYGNPFPKANISHYWQYYSLEDFDHELDTCTDVTGNITFPERTISAGLLMRIYGIVNEILDQGQNASIGPHTNVIASGKGYDNHLFYYNNQKTPQVIQLKKHAPYSLFIYRRNCE
ncbi:MAG: hypothetical protein ABIJ12_10185 [bacterium]